MKQTVTIEGQECTLATITVGAYEQLELEGKKGRAFNVAFIAACLLSAGDTERGTEAWVRSAQMFSPEGDEETDFLRLLKAANQVNGLKPRPVVPVGETGPEAPAILQ